MSDDKEISWSELPDDQIVVLTKNVLSSILDRIADLEMIADHYAIHIASLNLWARQKDVADEAELFLMDLNKSNDKGDEKEDE